MEAEEATRFAAGARIDGAFLGIELAEERCVLRPHTNITFLPDHPEYAGEASNLHCSGCILKPLTPDEIAHLRFPAKKLFATDERGKIEKTLPVLAPGALTSFSSCHCRSG